MKREQFQITSTAGHNVIKFKWNAALREIERLVKEMANNDGAGSVYHLTDKESIKSDCYFTSGFREWTREDGLIVKFSVIKVD